jgi:hypothetical protein
LSGPGLAPETPVELLYYLSLSAEHPDVPRALHLMAADGDTKD